MLAIKNAKIVLEDRIEEGKVLLFSDKIEKITDNIPKGCEVIDCEGGYITPGFIDLHIHGYLGKDVCDANVDSIKTIAGGLVENGVTGFLPTTMTVDMKVIE
ncbi:MAG: N-acetylglucosamine-6-phosphate deacetylase, partial [Clostridia bacterium]|nr:N-acetylglucosamine-6-phosphate deacetylase [Clostridia bacterium]